METSRFHYKHEAEEEEEEGSNLPCFLDIYVHHACNIHNICIYANQDVYAKFSLTSSPDDALSTRVVPGGGKNPRFDERLPPLGVARRRLDTSVLKCEIWMRSCAKRFLEDQLLGFALVPLTSVVASAGGRLAQDFTLSSTDLFHSPAGTIRLALALHSHSSENAYPPPEHTIEPSITSEVVILDPSPVDYGRIEFPDLNVVKENQEMAMQYFDMAATTGPAKTGMPFLHLGASSPQLPSIEDCEMSMSPHGEKSASSDESKNISGAFTDSTTTTVSDDRVSCSELMEKKSNADEVAPMSQCSPDTPTSKTGGMIGEAKDAAGKGEKDKNMRNVFKSPLADIIDLEAEQSAMQQQIMDMYMKSMQQFTESLAKMELPLELNGSVRGQNGDDGVVIQKNDKFDSEKKKSKKDGARVFYGSRAFF